MCFYLISIMEIPLPLIQNCIVDLIITACFASNFTITNYAMVIVLAQFFCIHHRNLSFCSEKACFTTSLHFLNIISKCLLFSLANINLLLFFLILIVSNIDFFSTPNILWYSFVVCLIFNTVFCWIGTFFLLSDFLFSLYIVDWIPDLLIRFNPFAQWISEF